jgi:hypothetical protein
MMQFSLKWILIAVVYVAVAAAAFSQESWAYADLLWAASLLAVVFAALLALMGRGKGRMAAAGFLLASLSYVACVAFGRLSSTDIVPTRRWLVTAGYDPNAVTYYPATPASGAPMYQSSGWTSYPPVSAYSPPAAASSPYTLSVSPTLVQPLLPVATMADFGIYVRAANAVSMMLFGGLGALLGLLASNRISQATPRTLG